MFYSEVILAKKGSLAKVWLAAHWERKLTKAQICSTNIQTSVKDIIGQEDQDQPMALRLSGQLLLGVVRIYSRKARYLLDDCNDALVRIKMAFRPGQVDMTQTQAVASHHAITLPEHEILLDFDQLLSQDLPQWDQSMMDVSFASVQTPARSQGRSSLGPVSVPSNIASHMKDITMHDMIEIEGVGSMLMNATPIKKNLTMSEDWLKQTQEQDLELEFSLDEHLLPLQSQQRMNSSLEIEVARRESVQSLMEAPEHDLLVDEDIEGMKGERSVQLSADLAPAGASFDISAPALDLTFDMPLPEHSVEESTDPSGVRRQSAEAPFSNELIDKAVTKELSDKVVPTKKASKVRSADGQMGTRKRKLTIRDETIELATEWSRQSRSTSDLLVRSPYRTCSKKLVPIDRRTLKNMLFHSQIPCTAGVDAFMFQIGRHVRPRTEPLLCAESEEAVPEPEVGRHAALSPRTDMGQVNLQNDVSAILGDAASIKEGPMSFADQSMESIGPAIGDLSRESLSFADAPSLSFAPEEDHAPMLTLPEVANEAEFQPDPNFEGEANASFLSTLMVDQEEAAETDKNSTTTTNDRNTTIIAALCDKFKNEKEQVLEFSQLARGAKRSDVARFFFEVLALKTGDFINVKQDQSKPFGEIQIRPKDKLFQHSISPDNAATAPTVH